MEEVSKYLYWYGGVRQITSMPVQSTDILFYIMFCIINTMKKH